MPLRFSGILKPTHLVNIVFYRVQYILYLVICEIPQTNACQKNIPLSQATHCRDLRRKLKNVATDLAPISETVTALNVGNKQQVTQMYTSHATQLVIHLSVWMKS